MVDGEDFDIIQLFLSYLGCIRDVDFVSCYIGCGGGGVFRDVVIFELVVYVFVNNLLFIFLLVVLVGNF